MKISKRCTDGRSILHAPSIPRILRILRVFWYSEYSQYQRTRYCLGSAAVVHTVRIEPRNAKSMTAVSAVQNVEILRELAVPRSTYNPNTASTRRTGVYSLGSTINRLYSQVLPGTARYCQVLPGTARYCEHLCNARINSSIRASSGVQCTLVWESAGSI